LKRDLKLVKKLKQPKPFRQIPEVREEN